MDFFTVQQTLNDLPGTFKRDGTPFTQWTDAETAELTRYTSAADETLQQVQAFDNARYGWLDFWGLLFNIARLLGQADSLYAQLISYAVTAGAGPGVAIATWIKVIWNVDATVTENLPGVGYSISFAQALTDDQVAAIIASLGRIRPAGVPLLGTASTTVGFYVGTINFAGGAPGVTGAYLTSGGGSGVAVDGISGATNNAVPVLPDLFLVDPALNS